MASRGRLRGALAGLPNSAAMGGRLALKPPGAASRLQGPRTHGGSGSERAFSVRVLRLLPLPRFCRARGRPEARAGPACTCACVRRVCPGVGPQAGAARAELRQEEDSCVGAAGGGARGADPAQPRPTPERCRSGAGAPPEPGFSPSRSPRQPRGATDSVAWRPAAQAGESRGSRARSGEVRGVAPRRISQTHPTSASCKFGARRPPARSQGLGVEPPLERGG